jgi:hypothetical protein
MERGIYAAAAFVDQLSGYSSKRVRRIDFEAA